MTQDPPAGTPAGRRWAALAVTAEALCVVAAALLASYSAATAEATSVGSAWALVAFAALGPAATLALAAGLYRDRSWARGPAIVLQLLIVPIGSYMVRGGLQWVGIVTIVWGLLTLALLLVASRPA